MNSHKHTNTNTNILIHIFNTNTTILILVQVRKISRLFNSVPPQTEIGELSSSQNQAHGATDRSGSVGGSSNKTASETVKEAKIFICQNNMMQDNKLVPCENEATVRNMMTQWIPFCDDCHEAASQMSGLRTSKSKQASVPPGVSSSSNIKNTTIKNNNSSSSSSSKNNSNSTPTAQTKLHNQGQSNGETKKRTFWTAPENEALLEGVARMKDTNDKRDFNQVSKLVGTRSAKQCRQRWNSHYKPSRDWSAADITNLKALYRVHNGNIVEIVKRVPHRTCQIVRSRLESEHFLKLLDGSNSLGKRKANRHATHNAAHKKTKEFVGTGAA